MIFIGGTPIKVRLDSISFFVSFFFFFFFFFSFLVEKFEYLLNGASYGLDYKRDFGDDFKINGGLFVKVLASEAVQGR